MYVQVGGVADWYWCDCDHVYCGSILPLLSTSSRDTQGEAETGETKPATTNGASTLF